MITLQFSRGTDISSDLIAWYEHGGWSHVDTVLPDGLLGARSDAIGGKPAGVQVRPKDYLGDEKTLVVELPCSSEMAGKYEDFLRAQIGKPYDVEGIAGFISGRNWSDPAAWFCSELVAAGLEACGYFEYPLAVTTHKITPADLLLILSTRVNLTRPQEG